AAEMRGVEADPDEIAEQFRQFAAIALRKARLQQRAAGGAAIAHPRTRIMRADDADARASRLCEYGATGTGKNQGMWEGLREMRGGLRRPNARHTRPRARPASCTGIIGRTSVRRGDC